jgi:hypothetical protein
VAAAAVAGKTEKIKIGMSLIGMLLGMRLVGKVATPIGVRRQLIARCADESSNVCNQTSKFCGFGEVVH